MKGKSKLFADLERAFCKLKGKREGEAEHTSRSCLFELTVGQIGVSVKAQEYDESTS
jgi:hypothetical protein